MPLTPSSLEPDGPRDCGRFLLDVVGQYARGRVKAEWRPPRRTHCPDVERIIEDAWLAETDRAAREGLQLFDGPLCRLIEYSADSTDLRLVMGPACHKDFHGTNLTHAHLRYTHGPEALANPLGVSAAVATSDGFLLFGRRSQRVASHAGRIHPIGGMVEPPKTAASRDCAPDLFGSIFRELAEEMGIVESQVSQAMCLGLVREKRIVQPELIFDLCVGLDVQACLAAWSGAGATPPADGKEHSEIVPVRDQPSSVVTFMERNLNDLTPVAQATLLLHGLSRWGSGWFATVRGYLQNVI